MVELKMTSLRKKGGESATLREPFSLIRIPKMSMGGINI